MLLLNWDDELELSSGIAIEEEVAMLLVLACALETVFELFFAAAWAAWAGTDDRHKRTATKAKIKI